MFQGDRKNFLKLVQRYNGYVELYALLNNGSKEGITPFEEFYWRFSYQVKYDDPAALWQSGY